MQVRFLSAAYGEWMNKDFLGRSVRFVKKNIKIVAPVILLILTAVITKVALSARNASKTPEPIPSASTAVIDVPVVTDPVEPVTQDFFLTENTDQDLAEFIETYYLCLSNGDIDTLEPMVDYIEVTDKLIYAEQSRYLDYLLKNIYTIQGFDESAYIVFAVSDVVFDAYPDNLLPSYDGFYVRKTENGNFCIITSDLPTAEDEYVNHAILCDDVVELGNRVTSEYNDVITASPELLTYMKELDSIVSVEVGEKLAALNSGEEIEMPEVEVPGDETEEDTVKAGTANSAVNVRISDSMNADRIGQLYAGQAVEVTEIKGNGWYGINYEGKTGYVKAEYITLEIDVDSVVTIGSVTATETLNMRSSPSTDGMIMGSFAKGTTARLVSEEDGWCEVVYNNRVVYLSSQYLEITLD